jgi:hypothetical protein
MKIDGDTSDGYHTFNELYYHRMILFSVICNQNKSKAWKSWYTYQITFTFNPVSAAHWIKKKYFDRT